MKFYHKVTEKIKENKKYFVFFKQDTIQCSSNLRDIPFSKFNTIGKLDKSYEK